MEFKNINQKIISNRQYYFLIAKQRQKGYISSNDIAYIYNEKNIRDIVFELENNNILIRSLKGSCFIWHIVEGLENEIN